MGDHGNPWEDALFVRSFWDKVTVSGADNCWPWIASGVRGRGRVKFQGKMLIAPRVAKAISEKKWPGNGLFACHSCDNPNCCNPHHIWWGTNSENMKDAGGKGRLRTPSEKCAKGHPKAGLRRCPICKTERQRQRRAEARK